jgi:hypothetical protein
MLEQLAADEGLQVWIYVNPGCGFFMSLRVTWHPWWDFARLSIGTRLLTFRAAFGRETTFFYQPCE